MSQDRQTAKRPGSWRRGARAAAEQASENGAGPRVDRLPPHNIEAEWAVVGCCIQEPELVESVAEQIKGWGPEVFYDLRVQRVWGILLEMRTANREIDVITLMAALRDANALEAVGGLERINTAINDVPSALNWKTYLDLVIEKFTARRVIARSVEAIARAYEAGVPVKDLVAEWQAEVVAVADEHAACQVLPHRDRMDRLIDSLERRHRGKQEITGLQTPFWYLNNMTAGLQPELIVIAARPSTGKTALGVDLAIHTLNAGKSVAFFSVEMSADQIMMRMFGNMARVNGMKLRNGFWKDDAEPRMQEAARRMAGWKLYLDDRSGITGQDVLLATRRLKREVGVDLVVVDYIQIMQAVQRHDNRQAELAEVSRLLKQTSKECNVPVVALAQLNRDAEKERGGRAPLISDIRDCGAIEQDADLVGMLWAPNIDEEAPEEMKWLEHHKPDDPKEDEVDWKQWFRRIDLKIGKNRNGPTGDCELVFQKSTARFEDAHSPTRVKEAHGKLL